MEDAKKCKGCCTKEKEELEELKKEIEQLKSSKNEWKECAKYYSEKFQLAYKGYLLTQGIKIDQAHLESLKVLSRIQSLNEP